MDQTYSLLTPCMGTLSWNISLSVFGQLRLPFDIPGSTKEWHVSLSIHLTHKGRPAQHSLSLLVPWVELKYVFNSTFYIKTDRVYWLARDYSLVVFCLVLHLYV